MKISDNSFWVSTLFSSTKISENYKVFTSETLFSNKTLIAEGIPDNYWLKALRSKKKTFSQQIVFAKAVRWWYTVWANLTN